MVQNEYDYALDAFTDSAQIAKTCILNKEKTLALKN